MSGQAHVFGSASGDMVHGLHPISTKVKMINPEIMMIIIIIKSLVFIFSNIVSQVKLSYSHQEESHEKSCQIIHEDLAIPWRDIRPFRQSL